MREAAAAADAMINALTYGGQNPPPFPQLPNGQYAMPVMPPLPMAQDEHGKKRKSRGEDADGKKKAKKVKDPNAPKRPASSYLLFQNEVRSELKAKHPELRNNELLGAIAKLWSEMPQEQKDVRFCLLFWKLAVQRGCRNTSSATRRPRTSGSRTRRCTSRARRERIPSLSWLHL